jgi:hypothetical protein
MEKIIIDEPIYTFNIRTYSKDENGNLVDEDLEYKSDIQDDTSPA